MAGLRVGTTSLDVGEEGKWGDSARQKERIEYNNNDNRMLVVFLGDGSHFRYNKTVRFEVLGST